MDTNGVIRWKGTDDEVSLFGANYTTPFAYAYRAHKRLGLLLKKAIDMDVAQMVDSCSREVTGRRAGRMRNGERGDCFLSSLKPEIPNGDYREQKFVVQ